MKKMNLHKKEITIYCGSKSCVEILQRGPKSNDMADLEKAESDIITSIFKLLEDFEDTAILNGSRVIKMMMTTPNLPIDTPRGKTKHRV